MKQAANQKSDVNQSRSVITGTFRASFPHLFKPSAIPGAKDLKYSVTMLFKKDQDLSTIKLALKSAKIDKFGLDQKAWPKNLLSPVEDGDSPKYADREGYKGHWVIKAATKEEYKPEVVDRNGEPILQASEFYPGCYARAKIFANAWEFGGKNGVSFILEHVQKVREGQPLSARKSARDTFGAVAMDDFAAEGEDEFPSDDADTESDDFT